ncbi:hypothetical protein [Phytohabitans rumicis]|uniref:Uncharacterized protein n=1 Tax=Phytohabitans rumicis TaxID=1076125 RepID=A0A6V8LIE6_9ACTN|nr:hypothetical protein [Phytohabitans rumicis]GFJ94681.1 hypothetical protein Prum_083230 [Phytohabitans rumicis]
MTTNRLSQALDDLSTEAGSYASYDAVVAATGRRRRRRTVLMAAAAVLAVSLGGGVVAALGASAPPPAPVAAWPEPDAPPRPLPATGAVGRGAFAYSTCVDDATCGSWLVTDDGSRYALPNPGKLSPDGRWLGYGLSPDKYLVRDLTGDTVWTVTGGMGGVVWSTDSRWLLLTDGTEPRQKWYLRLDTRTGEQRTSDVPFGFADAVLPSGEVLYTADPFTTGKQLLLTRYDPATGAKAEIQLAAGDKESAVEPDGQRHTVVAGPGNTVLIGLFSPDLTALLEYDLGTTDMIARHEVPEQAGEWQLIGYLPTDGIVLTRCDDEMTDVVLLNPVSGESRVVLTLPGKAGVTLAASDR